MLNESCKMRLKARKTKEDLIRVGWGLSCAAADDCTTAGIAAPC
jgi:hypothetical protein